MIDPEETTAKKKIVLNLRRTQSTENLQTKEFSEATEAELEQMSKMDSNLDIAKQSETAEENQQSGDEIRKTEPSPTVTVDPAAPTQSRRASEVNLYKLLTPKIIGTKLKFEFPLVNLNVYHNICTTV